MLRSQMCIHFDILHLERLEVVSKKFHLGNSDLRCILKCSIRLGTMLTGM